MRPLPEKPKSIDELEKLVMEGDMEILLAEDVGGCTHMLVQDNRRTYEEGELYEIWV